MLDANKEGLMNNVFEFINCNILAVAWCVSV